MANTNQVILRNYAKGIFLYPIMIYSLVAGIIEIVLEDKYPTEPYNSILAAIWIIFLLTNLIVLTFDITTGKFLATLLAIAAIILVLVILGLKGIINIPTIEQDVAQSFHPRMNAQVYFYTFAIFALIILMVLIQSRFKYIRLEKNEIYVKGILGNDRRFPTTGLRFKKNISDVFEWFALRAGTVILYIPNEEPIVLDTIPNISNKEKQLDQLLSSLKTN